MPTDKQKIEMYEALLHNLQMASSVTMDSNRVGKLLDRLEHLASLEKGWMDGMGERLSATAIETAGYFITITPQTADAYKIYPSETGGILIELEWDDWDYSVEIQPDGSVEMYGISLSDTQEITPMSFETEIKEHLGINCLTQSQASTIMSMYLKGTDVENMIEILKGEKK